ncbi:MAG: hypothetical protein ACO1RT_14350 [Planctomycetaceae bacterium]
MIHFLDFVEMWDSLQAAIDSLFIGPMWPASVLVLIIVGYLVLALVGAVDFDGPDWAVDADGWQSLGATSLRWFHLGTVPVIFWVGCFSILQWLIAYGLWHFFESSRYTPTLTESLLLAGRNAVLAALATKLVTGPLVPHLSEAPTFNEETIIGESCVICSSEATPTFGQAKYKTGGAPLLLNIRTDGVRLVKGDVATIVAYDTERRLYTVTASSVPSVAPIHET